ncbi:molecular chaperone DnaJ [archaeon]|nr:molecular chaperone DnaJ [archaeon]
MAEKDYYKTLGVEKNATKADIKKAFKKLAMKYHPDRAPEEKKEEFEEKFKTISEAAAILGDEKKRQQYDQFGSNAFGGGDGGQGFQGFDFSDIMSQFRFGNFGNQDDIFEQIFGGGGRRRGRKVYRGSDLLYDLDISLEKVHSGLSEEIKLNKLDHCSECQGKGGKNISTCSDCNGSGYTRVTRRTPFGVFQQQAPCGSCHGEGEKASEVCHECDGEGLIRDRSKITVKIPAGVSDGMRLRVSSKGEAGRNGGPHGDLYVRIHVKEHKFFERQDDDLHVSVPISFYIASLGGEIEVPTIAGSATLKIPKGTDSETIFRMKGKGLPKLRGSGNGDQMVKVTIQVPKKLSKKQKKALEDFGDNKPQKGFLERFFG